MFARWQGERVHVRTVVCLAVAIAVHAAALTAARRPTVRASDALGFFDALVEAPALADVAPRPAAAVEPEAAPDVAAPTQPATVSNAPARRAVAGDPYEPEPAPLPDRGREAVAAAVAAARSLLTGDDALAESFAMHDSDLGPGYGFVAGDALGTTATFDRGAVLGGAPRGGAGTALHGHAGHGGDGELDEGPDHSRGSHVIGGLASDCAFPDGATGIDDAVVPVVVSVRKDGSAAEVIVAHDPGHGFGAAARRCALRRHYQPALDRHGNPVASLTPLVNVRFTR